MPSLDVLVVGAGPSGLFIACELLRRGLSVRIIDLLPTPSDKSKALGIQARTMEMFNHVGILDAFFEAGLKTQEIAPMSRGKRIGKIIIDQMDSFFPFILLIDQSETERILYETLKSLGGKVERGIELISFVQHEERVNVHLKNTITNAIEEASFRWMIGADGAHSTTRKQLNLPFEGKAISGLYSLADVEIDWKYSYDIARPFFEKRRTLMFIPLKGYHRFRVIHETDMPALKEDHGLVSPREILPPSFEELEKLFQKVCDPTLKIRRLIWSTYFRLSSRLTKHFRVGNIFLIGDAAHIHSPVGGQGMNYGLQDGFNLAWKLELVHKKKSSSLLLDTYEQERKQAAKKLLQITERLTSLFLSKNFFVRHMRGLVVRLILSQRWVQKRLANTLGQITLFYPKNRIIQEKYRKAKKTRAGHRAPDALIQQGNHDIQLSKLFQKDLYFEILFIDLKGDLSLLVPLCHECEQKIHPLGKVYGVTSFHANHPRLIVDLYKQIENHYEDRVIYVIRPDGYVGFLGTLEDTDSVILYLKEL